jgi:hypothetical protein
MLEGSSVVFAGSAWEAPEADQELRGDWFLFLIPGVVDHRVHIGFSGPRWSPSGVR